VVVVVVVVEEAAVFQVLLTFVSKNYVTICLCRS